MRKIIITLVLLLVILGCDKNTTSNVPVVTPEDIYKGSDGLVMSFLENAPPNQVFENSFTVTGLNLKNKGVYDIKDGYLAISMEKDYMDSVRSSLKSTSKYVDFSDYEHITFDLKGKSVLSLDGDEDTFTFTTEIKDLEELSSTHTTTIAVTACYEYMTGVTETICLDSDIYNIRKREKSCTIEDNILTDQGAPIAVTKIETKMLPNEGSVEPQFVITIENKASGLAINKNSVKDACYSKELNYDELNKIEVNTYLTRKGERIKLDCNIEDESETAYVTLKENKALVRCKYREGIDEEEGTYSTPLIIEINYGYTQTISKQVEIKKIVE